MSGPQRRIPAPRRSARLEEVPRRTVVHGIPASESEEDLVVIPNQGIRPDRNPERSVSPEVDVRPGEAREDLEVDPVERSSEEDVSSDEVNIMVGNTRLKYTKFRGDDRMDVDDWMAEFEATAEANQEDPASKRRVFHGLLKGEALRWYQDIPEAIRNDWAQLTDLFLRTFREVGGEARALGRLSKVTMRPNESVRKYGQRVKGLIKKLTTDIAASIQVEWYVAGFPEEMGFQIRQSRPTTLREAMESAENYENSAQSLRRSIKRSEKMEKGRSKKYEKRERQRRKFSESETSGSGSGTEDSSSGISSSEAETSSNRRMTRNKIERTIRKPVKVKEEEEETKKFMQKVQDTLEAIKVNLAENRAPRRALPVSRANVWCSKCGRPGHYPSECTHVPPKQIHFVDEEGVYYTLPETEDYEEHVNPVFQIQAGYGRGRVPQQLIRTNAGHSGMAGSSQGNYPPSRFPPGCCFICGSPQHYANSCPHKGYGQGAPLPLPCQNCGEYGHRPEECPKPQQVRTLYKHVDIPPRDQTALNYGSTVGVEKPEK